MNSVLGVKKILVSVSFATMAVACSIGSEDTGSSTENLDLSDCPAGQDGLYCGDNGLGKEANMLYRCARADGGRWRPTAVSNCTSCVHEAQGKDDHCAAARCPSGDGDYCGGNGIGGDPYVLYHCAGGNLTPVSHALDERCQPQPLGVNDKYVKSSEWSPRCPSGDGFYCGGNGIDGNAGTLYRCTTKHQKYGDEDYTYPKVEAVETCGTGCLKHSSGEDDVCATPQCPAGDGLYCGGNTVGGDTWKLYRCTGGKLTVEHNCTFSCQTMPKGQDDRCANPIGAENYPIYSDAASW